MQVYFWSKHLTSVQKMISNSDLYLSLNLVIPLLTGLLQTDANAFRANLLFRGRL